MRPNTYLFTNLPPVLDGLGSVEPYELEERCRDYLVSLRWPEGVACPRCEETRRLLWLESRSKWHCYTCRYQFSVTAKTLFHNSHLPLSKWFLGVHLFVESPDGVPANQLKQVLDCSYKTAWFAAHRIRVALRRREEPFRPEGSLSQRRRFPGPYQHSSVKYLSAYLDERNWRSANRGNTHVFRDTILALLRGEGVSYDQLVAAR
jgi:transposase-like protein